MNFKNNIATTREQSERLLSLGVPIRLTVSCSQSLRISELTKAVGLQTAVLRVAATG